MCGPYYMYKKRYSAADACHSVRGFVNGSWHSNALGKEMLRDQDLVMLSDYIRKKSQCRYTPKICRLSVSVVFAPALSSAVPFLFFFFPLRKSQVRGKNTQPGRGAKYWQCLTTCVPSPLQLHRNRCWFISFLLISCIQGEQWKYAKGCASCEGQRVVITCTEAQCVQFWDNYKSI